MLLPIEKIKDLCEKFGQLCESIKEPLQIYFADLEKNNIPKEEIIAILEIEPVVFDYVKQGNLMHLSCEEFFKLALLVCEKNECFIPY